MGWLSVFLMRLCLFEKLCVLPAPRSGLKGPREEPNNLTLSIASLVLPEVGEG